VTLRLARGVAAAALLAASAPGLAEDADAEMGRRVQALLRAHQAEIFACVARAAAPVEGEALLRVVVGHGAPRTVAVLKVDPPAVRAAAECVAGAARSWDLGSLGAGDGDQVVFPLAFKPEQTAAAAVGARLRKLTMKKGTSAATRISRPLAWFVVTGTVALETGASKVLAGPDDVVFVAGEGTVTLLARTAAELIVIESTTPPDSASARLVHRSAAGEKLRVAGGQGDVRLYLDGVPAPFAVDKLCAGKGTSVPRHEHPSDELLYVLSGKGTTTLGDHSDVERAGDFVTIPRGTPHALVVDEALCAVQVYAPQGPEQRFKEKKAP
jgi:quercetin dioxygenase-like cupin family protein